VALTAALAAWYLTPWPALAALWALGFAALTWRWPRWALALLPLTFPFWYAPVHVTDRLAFPLSELALAIVTLVALGHFGARLARSRRQRPGHWARAFLARMGALVPLGAGLLLVGMTTGLLIARQPQPALRAWRWEIAEPLVYAALAVWLLRGRWLWRSLWSFIASGVMVAGLALAQTLFAHVTFAPLGAGGGLVPYPAWSGFSWRATAVIYGSPNSAGAWMARAAPLALAVALWPRASGRTGRIVAALSVVALLIGLTLTGSRGAWLGVAAGVIVSSGIAGWAWFRGPHLVSGPAALAHGDPFPLRGEGMKQQTVEGQAPLPSRESLVARSPLLMREGQRVRWRRAFPVVIALVVALIYGGSAFWLTPLVGLAGGAHGGSGEVRLLVWRAAEAMARDHALLGVGPDQFLYYYDPRYTDQPYLIATQNGHPTAAASEPNLSHPHNLGLELWLSAGLLGLMGFILALVGAVTRGWETLAAINGLRAPDGWRGAAVAGIMGALAAGLAHGLVDSAYFQPDLALAFWWSVAALVALGRAPSRRTKSAG
jgi:hypothetical protein